MCSSMRTDTRAEPSAAARWESMGSSRLAVRACTYAAGWHTLFFWAAVAAPWSGQRLEPRPGAGSGCWCGRPKGSDTAAVVLPCWRLAAQGGRAHAPSGAAARPGPRPASAGGGGPWRGGPAPPGPPAPAGGPAPAGTAMQPRCSTPLVVIRGLPRIKCLSRSGGRREGRTLVVSCRSFRCISKRYRMGALTRVL